MEPDREKAGELLSKALRLDPKNPEVCTALAKHLEFKMSYGDGDLEQRRQLASRALELREQIIDVMPAREKYFQLKELAWDALYCGNETKAQTYAEQLLELSRDDDKYLARDLAFHQGNLVLGAMALRRRNVEEAKARLLAAGKVQPTADSLLRIFGPEMRLAYWLLELKQTETVLQYLDACENFRPEKATLDQWRKTIRDGGLPNFWGPWVRDDICKT